MFGVTVVSSLQHPTRPFSLHAHSPRDSAPSRLESGPNGESERGAAGWGDASGTVTQRGCDGHLCVCFTRRALVCLLLATGTCVSASRDGHLCVCFSRRALVCLLLAPRPSPCNNVLSRPAGSTTCTPCGPGSYSYSAGEICWAFARYLGLLVGCLILCVLSRTVWSKSSDASVSTDEMIQRRKEQERVGGACDRR